MIAKVVCGVVVGILIGIGCRFFEIPLPGPPAILGAFLAVAMATGYTVTDKVPGGARTSGGTEDLRRGD